MADSKISALPASTLPLAGTEVLPIVQSGATKKVATNDLTVKNIRSNATTGILQVAGPGAGTTRTMTTPNANFTAARTDAAQTFTGVQTFTSPVFKETVDLEPKYTGGFAGGYTTVVDLTTLGDRFLIRATGNEFSYNNASYGLWIAVRDTGTSTYTLALISQVAHGNGHGTVNLQMSGNNLQIKNANSSSIGAYSIQLEKMV